MDDTMTDPGTEMLMNVDDEPGVEEGGLSFDDNFEWQHAISESGVKVAKITIPNFRNTARNRCVPNEAKRTLPSDYTDLMVIRPVTGKAKITKNMPVAGNWDAPKRVLKIVRPIKDGCEGEASASDSTEVICEDLTSGTKEKSTEVKKTHTRLCYRCPFNYENNLYLGSSELDSGPNKNKACGNSPGWTYVCPVCVLNCDEVCSSTSEFLKHLTDHECLVSNHPPSIRVTSSGTTIVHGTDDKPVMENLYQAQENQGMPRNFLLDVLVDPQIMTKMTGNCQSFNNMARFYMHLKAHLHVMKISLFCRHCHNQNCHADPAGNLRFLDEDCFLKHLATKHCIIEGAQPMLIALKLRMSAKPKQQASHMDTDLELPSIPFKRFRHPAPNQPAAPKTRVRKMPVQLANMKKDDPSWVLPYILCPCIRSGCNYMTRDLLWLGQHIEQHLRPMGMRWVAVCRLCFLLFPGMVSAAHHVLTKHSGADGGVICQTVAPHPAEGSSLADQSSATSLADLLGRKSVVEKVLSDEKMNLYRGYDLMKSYVEYAGGSAQEDDCDSAGVPVVLLMKLGLSIFVRHQVHNLSDYNDWKFWIKGNRWKTLPLDFMQKKLMETGDSSIIFATGNLYESEQRRLQPDTKHIEVPELPKSAKSHAEQQFQKMMDYMEKKYLKDPSENQSTDDVANLMTGVDDQSPQSGSEQSSLGVNGLLLQPDQSKTRSMNTLSKERAELQFQKKRTYLERKYLQPSVEVTHDVPELLTSTRHDDKTWGSGGKRRKTDHYQEDVGSESRVDDGHQRIQQFILLRNAHHRRGVRCMFKADDRLFPHLAEGETVQSRAVDPFVTLILDNARTTNDQIRQQQQHTSLEICPDHNQTTHADLEYTVVGISASVFSKCFVVMKEMATEMVFQCPYCLFVRQKISDVAYHLAVMHEAKESAAMTSVDQTVYNVSTRTPFLYCRFCSFVTPYLLSMWRHFQNVHQFRIQLAPLQGNQHFSSQGGLACCKCSFATDLHVDMVQHIEESHAKDLDVFRLGYVVCRMKVQPAKTGASGGLVSVLQRLLAQPVQEAVLAFLCLHCEKRFTSVWSIESHYLESHGEGMLFYCVKCDFTFDEINLITEHLIFHTENKFSVGMKIANERHIFVWKDVEEEDIDGQDDEPDEPPTSDEDLGDAEDECVVTIRDRNICVPMNCLDSDLQEQLQHEDGPSWVALLPLTPDADGC